MKQNTAITKRRVKVEKEKHELRLALVLMVIYILIKGSNEVCAARSSHYLIAEICI